MTKHSPSLEATACQANENGCAALNRRTIEPEIRCNESRITRLLSSFELRHAFVIVYSLGFICGGTFENQMHWLRRVHALLDLLLQRALGFRGQVAFCCFFPCKLRQDRQFALHILS